MGDAKLNVIAAELITKVRTGLTIDWTLRESARALGVTAPLLSFTFPEKCAHHK